MTKWDRWYATGVTPQLGDLAWPVPWLHLHKKAQGPEPQGPYPQASKEPYGTLGAKNV